MESVEEVKGQKAPKAPAKEPFRGLPNDKLYICYMNSVIQCLMATPGFQTIFEQLLVYNKKASTYKGQIATAFAQVFKKYKEEKVEKKTY